MREDVAGRMTVTTFMQEKKKRMAVRQVQECTNTQLNIEFNQTIKIEPKHVW